MITRRTALAVFVAAAAVLVSGCAQLSSAMGEFADIGEAIGVVDSSTANRARIASTGIQTLDSIVDASTSPFTPEQEYYIGRSVAATILDSYETIDDPAATRYINLLGQSLALASDRPQLYHGYTFQILEGDEINAFATPGGHIFITRGMLALTETEDELAAVLAHEIGHVAMRHGLGSIRTARVISAVQDGMFEALETVTDAQLEEVTAVFGDTTADVVDTLATRGYSGATERQADGAAVTILRRLGYDPYAIIRVLERMDQAQRDEYEGEAEPRGFSKTHPRPASRIADIRRTDLRDVPPGGRVDAEAAQARFDEAFRNL